MTRAATATILAPLRDTIPGELKARPQWVAWRRALREGEPKPTKVPYCAVNRLASSTDPATWLSFEAAWALYVRGAFDGVGYVFSPDDPYCGIDLDPELPESDRQTILQRFKSYIEMSPSGQGQHIIVKATLPGGGRKKGALEVYDRARYFTVTGHVIEGALLVIEEQQKAVDWLLAMYFSPQRDTKPNANGDGLGVTGGDLLARAFDAANGDKLRRLWNNDTADYPSASEADLALASLLAFWTGPDAIKLETLMRSSGLAREKWDKRHYGDGGTYLQAVIAKALSGRAEFYAASNHANDHSKEHTSPHDPLTALRELQEAPSGPDAETSLRSMVTALSGADPLRVASVRAEAITVLTGKKVSSPAGLVDAALRLLPNAESDDKPGVLLADPDPWPELVEGGRLLRDLATAIRRFVVLSNAEALACALWVIFGHAHDAFTISPILAVLSATKRCGKSTLLEVLSALLPRALATSNVSSAVLFRTIETYKPSLVIDEADSFLPDNEELRGILNSGHKRTLATILRLVGDAHKPTMFSTWAPKVLASIGELPGTVQDRAIVITLRRRRSDELVERYRFALLSSLTPLCQQAARWAHDHVEELKVADPDVPKSLNDRTADNWRPLLAIADLAGAEWGKKARLAAVEISGDKDGEQGETDGHGVTLIGDAMMIFDDRHADRLSSADLIDELTKVEGRPWADWSRGRPITPRALARLLKPFGIAPKVERIDDKERLRGYYKKAFSDSHARYYGKISVTSVTREQIQGVSPNLLSVTNPSCHGYENGVTIEKHRIVTDGADNIPDFGGVAGVSPSDETPDDQMQLWAARLSDADAEGEPDLEMEVDVCA